MQTNGHVMQTNKRITQTNYRVVQTNEQITHTMSRGRGQLEPARWSMTRWSDILLDRPIESRNF
jgi:hypothetical protein